VSIDIFKPLTMTTLVGTSATQIGGVSATGGTGQQSGVTSFRIHCLVAGTIGWGQTAASAVSTAAAANAPQNSITMAVGATVYFELPYGTFFISSAIAGFEVQGGHGGVGG